MAASRLHVVYGKLLDEEVSDISPEALATSSDGGSILTKSLERIIQNAIAPRLTGFLCVDKTLVVAPSVSISFGGLGNFSGNLLSYLAEVFADGCRDLLLFGAKEASLSVAFSGTLFRFALLVDFGKEINALEKSRYLANWKSDFGTVSDLLQKVLTRTQVAADLEIRENQPLVRLAIEAHEISYLTAGG